MTKEELWLLNEKHGGVETKAFKEDLERLHAGEPVDYIIGHIPFLGCFIDLVNKPLIPRPETELWVERALYHIKKSGVSHPKILDIFAGSGCIGIATLQHIPDAHVDFGENDPRALDQIRRNLTLNRIKEDRATIIPTDALADIHDTYDFVLANPPYIDPSKPERIQDSVIAWEPKEALFAGDNGLAYIKLLLQNAKTLLNERGTMYIEFDSPQKSAIATHAKNLNLTIEFWRDQYERWRVAVVSLA